MADFEYVACPKCHDKFMAGEEFFRLPQAYCHCPYCGNKSAVGVASGEAAKRRISAPDHDIEVINHSVKRRPKHHEVQSRR